MTLPTWKASVGFKMIESCRAVGGVRLSVSGLHLGHFVGTFAAASALGESRDLYYVIKDTEPFIWPNLSTKIKCIEMTARQALAISPSGLSVRPVLMSRILRHAWSIENCIYDIVNYTSLVTAHFSKDVIRQGKFKGSMRNFIFPLDEAVVFTFLRVDRFYSNRDNERVVRFVRDVQRRLVSRDLFSGQGNSLTSLVHYPGLPFLPGSDHRRMHTNGNNVLHVSADEEAVSRFCRSSFSLRLYLGEYPGELTRFKSSVAQDFVPGDMYAPFALARVFCGEEVLDSMRNRYVQTREQREVLSEELAAALNLRIREWRARAIDPESQSWKYDKLVEQSDQISLDALSVWGDGWY